MLAEEPFDRGHLFGGVENGPAVRRTVKDVEFHRQPGLFIGAGEFVGLVDRHLRILIPVEEQQWRILAIHMNNRAGEACEIRVRLGLAAEQ